MRKRKRNKALLSIFLSALLLMSGAFQALASEENIESQTNPENVEVQEVEPVEEELKDDVADKQAEEEKQKAEAERVAQEEQAKIEAERVAQEEQAKAEAERVAQEEQAKVEGEKIAQEALEKEETKKTAQEIENTKVEEKDEDEGLQSGKPTVSSNKKPDFKVLDKNDKLNVLDKINLPYCNVNWQHDFDFDLDFKFDCDVDFKLDLKKFPDLKCNCFTKLSFEKEWYDDYKGYRYPVKIDLMVEKNNSEKVVGSFYLSAPYWRKSFYVPKYHHGKEIIYTIKERKVPGYDTEIEKDETKNKFIIHNIKNDKYEFEVEKVWVGDENYQDSRPASINYQIIKNNELLPEVYTLNKADDWKDVLTLPAYDKNGRIEYTFKEQKVEGYTTEIEIKVENTQSRCCPKPEIVKYRKVWIKNKWNGKITVEGEKTWDDLMNRPAKIIVKLLRNNEIADQQEVEPGEDGKWMYEFPNLDKFDKAGKAYVYTIEEVEIQGYTVEVDGYDLKNYQERGTLILKKVDVDGVLLPGAVFTIFDKDGNRVCEDKTTGEDGTFTVVLPLGKYKIKEITAPDGYKLLEDATDVTLETDKETRNIEVTNEKIGPTPEPEKIDIAGEKTWDDLMNRPAKIIVKLLRDNEITDQQEVEPGKDGKWMYQFTNLDKFDNAGRAYVYTIEEVEIPGYTVEVDGYDLKNYQKRGTVVLNKVNEDEVLLPGAVFRIFDEEENRVGEDKTTGDDGTFTVVLPLGKYTIKEITAPAGYKLLGNTIDVTLETDGETINLEVKNQKTGPIPETGGKIAIKGEKTWDDLMNRPDVITVKLLRNNEEFKELEVKPNDDGKWIYEFKDLDETDDEGNPYTYTIEEGSVFGYTVEVDGYNLKNYQNRGTLVVNKVDENKVGLQGAVFAVYDLMGNLIDTKTSGKDGKFEITLPLGMYRIKEVSAPKGYDKKNFSRLVVLTRDQETVNLEIENKKITNGFGPLPNTGGGTSGGGFYRPTLPRTGTVNEPMLYILGLFSLFVGGNELGRKKRKA